MEDGQCNKTFFCGVVQCSDDGEMLAKCMEVGEEVLKNVSSSGCIVEAALRVEWEREHSPVPKAPSCEVCLKCNMPERVWQEVRLRDSLDQMEKAFCKRFRTVWFWQYISYLLLHKSVLKFSCLRKYYFT